MNNIPEDLNNLEQDKRFGEAREIRDSEASVQDGYITELRADFEKFEAWYVLIPSFEQSKKEKIEKLK